MTYNPFTRALGQVSDEDFVEMCYQQFLGRPSDAGGREYFRGQLRQGMARMDLIKALVSSVEYHTLLTRQLFQRARLPDLRQIRPDKYAMCKVRGREERAAAFHATQDSDFDWLEAMILEHGYYQQPGVWRFGIDEDKQVIAEMVSRFKPSRCLEIGCSSGAVLKVLRDQGIEAEGVEISHLALALSLVEQSRIHYGDILKLDLKAGYDFVLGMDVFEHLNPNRLEAYLKRCGQLLEPGGFLLTNIPALGRDQVFGEVFPLDLEDWLPAAGRLDGKPLTLIPVDEKGWPIHGHLVWATAGWWQAGFERAGFKREMDIERMLQSVYEPYFTHVAPGRKSLFVFSKNVSVERAGQVVQTLRTTRASCGA
jgi:SAM-dependent methyltransferase